MNNILEFMNDYSWSNVRLEYNNLLVKNLNFFKSINCVNVFNALYRLYFRSTLWNWCVVCSQFHPCIVQVSHTIGLRETSPDVATTDRRTKAGDISISNWWTQTIFLEFYETRWKLTWWFVCYSQWHDFDLVGIYSTLTSQWLQTEGLSQMLKVKLRV